MASAHTLLSVMQAAISGVTGSVIGAYGPIAVRVGLAFPPIKVLQANVRGGTALVSVVDRKVVHNTTRWKPSAIADAVTPATLTSQISSSTVNGLYAQTITLGGTITPGDAVSCIVISGPIIAGVVVVAVAGDTLLSMVNKLASVAAADATMARVATIATGPTTLTLAAKSATYASYFKVHSTTGNAGTRLTEIGRRSRQLQVIVWTNSIEDRDTIGDMIEAMLAKMEAGRSPYEAGLLFPDGTTGRLINTSDFNLDEATASDTYRRDFLFSVDYPVTSTDALYAVLAQINTIQPNFYPMNPATPPVWRPAGLDGFILDFNTLG